MKRKVVTGIMLTLVLISMLTLAFNVQTATQASSSSDWLSGWSYRKSHEINNATGAGTNYQIKIKAHYGSGTDSGEDVYLNSNSRTDFGDVRFTDDNETTLLDYWMEEKVDGDYAVFWVEVAADLDSNVTIYIYYGNAAATTTSNGVNTFLFFDDCEDLSRWTEGYSSGTPIFEQTTIDGYSVIRLQTNSHEERIYIKSTTTVPRAKAIVSRVKHISFNSDSYHRFSFHWVNSTNWINYHDYESYFDRYQLRKMVNGSHTIVDTYSATHPYGWYTYEVYDDGTNIDVNRDTADILDGVISDAVLDSDGYLYIMNYQYSGGTSELAIDNIFVRNYVDPEPSHGSWGVEESQIVTPAYALSIKLSGDFDYAPAENIKLKLAALVKDVDTMEAVSDANVTIDIYYPNGTLWVSDNMTERHVGTGIYEWESNDTIYEMNTEKDIYLVHVKASVGDGPVATDMLLFHIDPPPDNSTLSFKPLIYYVIAVALIAAGTLTGIALLRRYRKLQIAPK